MSKETLWNFLITGNFRNSDWSFTNKKENQYKIKNNQSFYDWLEEINK